MEVDLEALPAVTTLDEALAPDAPLLHDHLRVAGHFRDLANLRPIPHSNICHHFHFARGEIAQGFAEADVIFEDTFTFPMVHHYSMEPHVAIAQVEHDQITVWASTQHPFPVRKELAEMFGLPMRLQNLLRRGEEFAPGDLPIDCDFHGSLKRVAEAIDWGQPTGARQGRGLACVIKAPLAPSISSAVVRMHADGSVTLLTGTVEIGQGARTVLAQIVAEELALPLA